MAHGVPGLAWNAGQAYPAPILIDAKMAICIWQRDPKTMFLAAFLIVSVIRDRSCRASLDAEAARAVSIEQTIGMMIRIGPGGRGNRDPGNDRVAYNGFATRRNESVAEAKGPEARNVSGMTLTNSKRSRTVWKCLMNTTTQALGPPLRNQRSPRSLPRNCRA